MGVAATRRHTWRVRSAAVRMRTRLLDDISRGRARQPNRKGKENNNHAHVSHPTFFVSFSRGFLMISLECGESEATAASSTKRIGRAIRSRVMHLVDKCSILVKKNESLYFHLFTTPCLYTHSKNNRESLLLAIVATLRGEGSNERFAVSFFFSMPHHPFFTLVTVAAIGLCGFLAPLAAGAAPLLEYQNATEGDDEMNEFKNVSNFIIVMMPIMGVAFCTTLWIFFRCPWFSGAPSVYTRLRRVGLSPVHVGRHGGTDMFHSLYIPKKPCRTARDRAASRSSLDDDVGLGRRTLLPSSFYFFSLPAIYGGGRGRIAGAAPAAAPSGLRYQVPLPMHAKAHRQNYAAMGSRKSQEMVSEQRVRDAPWAPRSGQILRLLFAIMCHHLSICLLLAIEITKNKTDKES
eukprot:gene4638-3341_t